MTDDAALRDRDWWLDWGQQFNWSMYGFSYRDTASFRNARDESIQITATTRADIEAYLATTRREALEETAQTLDASGDFWKQLAARQIRALLEEPQS